MYSTHTPHAEARQPIKASEGQEQETTIRSCPEKAREGGGKMVPVRSEKGELKSDARHSRICSRVHPPAGSGGDRPFPRGCMEGVSISHREGLSWNLLDRMFAAVWMMTRRDRELSQLFAAEWRGKLTGALQIHLLVCHGFRSRQCQ